MYSLPSNNSDSNISFFEKEGLKSPFIAEYENFIQAYPGRGTLKIQASTAREAYPIENVAINVCLIYSGIRYSIYRDLTDSSGIVKNMVLPARRNSASIAPYDDKLVESHYLVSLYHPDFKPVLNTLVTVYNNIETILNINMTPNQSYTEEV